MNKYTRINQQITAAEVRLIDEKGEQAGVVKLSEALARAEAVGLDVVEVAPSATPPVVRIVDWGKFRYAQMKLEQKARRKQHVQDIKQIRLGLKIGQHDLDVKLRKIRQFLEDGDIVKISVMFRGREITHPELGHELLNKITTQFDDIAAVDSPAQLFGRFLSLTIRRK